jgi:hypothetical protein
VSSAILYLAIVVIWAFLLVPRWVRRPHTALFSGHDAASQRDSGHDTEDADADADEAEAGLARHHDDGLAADSAADAPPAARPGLLRSVGPTGVRPADWPDEDQPEPDTAPLPVITAPRPAHAPAAPQGAPTPADTSAAASASPAGLAGPGGPAYPPVSRAKIVQARRRLLTTLILLAVAAVTCTVLRLTSWWVLVPPAGMLGMYLLLLREAALADAERARWRAEQAHAARQRARTRTRLAGPPQPDAEIIDISARLGDQLYDQYADAEARAVGDWPS